jgi:hypothetical protein
MLVVLQFQPTPITLKTRIIDDLAAVPCLVRLKLKYHQLEVGGLRNVPLFRLQ